MFLRVPHGKRGIRTSKAVSAASYTMIQHRKRIGSVWAVRGGRLQLTDIDDLVRDHALPAFHGARALSEPAVPVLAWW